MAYNFLISGVSCKDVCLNGPRDTKFSCLLESLTCRGVNTSSFLYVHNGSPIENCSSQLDITSSEDESHLVVIRAYSQLKGGKGGFGALIRAMGMRMNRNRNKDACRDLTGRRLRSVNAEKKVADLMKKEPEKRRKQAEEKAEKRRRLLEGPRHKFNDQEYIQKLEATQDNFEDALKQGLTAGNGGVACSTVGGACTSSGKRRAEENKEEDIPTKRLRLWMDNEDLDSDITDSEGEQNDNDGGPLIDTIPTMPTIPPVSITPQQHKEDNTIATGSTTPSSDHTPTPSPDHAHHPSGNTPPPSDHAPTPSSDNTPPIDKSVNDEQQPPVIPVFCYEDFKLNDYSCLEDLEAIGGDGLKVVLQKKGLKCGGTPHERAVRLWSIKGRQLKDIDPSLLANTGKGRTRNKGKKKA